MNESLVLISKTDDIGCVSLNRSSGMNAFNLRLAEEFIAAVETHGKDSRIRVVVVNGNGRVFSAGGDVKEMNENVRKGDRAAYFREPLAAFNRMAMAVKKCAKPVVASVHGAVAGVSFNLMLSCDLRIAAEGTKFTQAFISIGLSPDGGGTYVLPRMLGYARACELTMLPSGIDAQKALSWGIVNRVVPADLLQHETMVMARELAGGPAEALARTKALLNRDTISELENRMELERLAQVENADTYDFEEGVRAFLEKRKPIFKGK